jgi:hypothetical protein
MQYGSPMFVKIRSLGFRVVAWAGCEALAHTTKADPKVPIKIASTKVTHSVEAISPVRTVLANCSPFVGELHRRFILS